VTSKVIAEVLEVFCTCDSLHKASKTPSGVLIKYYYTSYFVRSVIARI